MDELTLEARHSALLDHWQAVVEAARAIGVDHTRLHSVGVVLEGRGERFGALRLPVYLEGRLVADIACPRGAAAGALDVHSDGACPHWLNRLLRDPATHPLAY